MDDNPSRARRGTFSRNFMETPYEVAVSALALLYGLAAVVAGPTATPNSLDDHLPRMFAGLWCVLLAVGGMAVLVGRALDELNVESAGLALQLGALVCYGLVLAAGAPSLGSALFTILSYSALSVATGVRLYVLRVALRARRPRG